MRRPILLFLTIALSSLLHADDKKYTNTDLICLYKNGSISDKLEITLKVANCHEPTCKIAMVGSSGSSDISLNVEVTRDQYKWENSRGTIFILNRTSGELIYGKKDVTLGPYNCSVKQQRF